MKKSIYNVIFVNKDKNTIIIKSFTSYQKALELKNNLDNVYNEIYNFNIIIDEEAKTQASIAVIEYFKNYPIIKYEHIPPDFSSPNYMSQIAAAMANGYNHRLQYEDRLMNMKLIENKTYNEYFNTNKKEYEHGEGKYEIIKTELCE